MSVKYRDEKLSHTKYFFFFAETITFKNILFRHLSDIRTEIEPRPGSVLNETFCLSEFNVSRNFRCGICSRTLGDH